MITKKELIVFQDKSPPQRLNINHVKNACYKSGQIKVLADKTLEIYNKKLHLKKSHEHSKIYNEQIAMNSSGEDWVTIDDQSRLTYFLKGKLRLLHDFDGTVSLNLLSGENVIIKHNLTGTMKCFSLQNGNLTVT